MFVAQGILGEWSLIREWGRVGSPGTVRKDWFETEEEAMTARQTLYDAKQKKGYHLAYLLTIVRQGDFRNQHRNCCADYPMARVFLLSYLSR